jgi:hypothetical protein
MWGSTFSSSESESASLLARVNDEVERMRREREKKKTQKGKRGGKKGKRRAAVPAQGVVSSSVGEPRPVGAASVRSAALQMRCSAKDL